MGRKNGAAYSVTGSITAFGQQISVDVRLLDTATGNVLSGVYVQGRGRENLGAILSQLSQDIALRIAAPAEKIVRIVFAGNRKSKERDSPSLEERPENVFSRPTFPDIRPSSDATLTVRQTGPDNPRAR